MFPLLAFTITNANSPLAEGVAELVVTVVALLAPATSDAASKEPLESSPETSIIPKNVPEQELLLIAWIPAATLSARHTPMYMELPFAFTQGTSLVSASPAVSVKVGAVAFVDAANMIMLFPAATLGKDGSDVQDPSAL